MKWWIAVLVLGVILTASGTGIGRNDGSPTDVTCGSDVMGPGDVCEETRRGVVTDTYTYEEKVRDNKEGAAAFAKTGRWVQLGIGIGLILIAVTGIVLTKRRRARQPPTTADLYLRQQAAQQHQVAAQQTAWPRQAPHWQPPPPPQYQQPYRQPPQQYPDFGPRG